MKTSRCPSLDHARGLSYLSFTAIGGSQSPCSRSPLRFQSITLILASHGTMRTSRGSCASNSDHESKSRTNQQTRKRSKGHPRDKKKRHWLQILYLDVFPGSAFGSRSRKGMATSPLLTDIAQNTLICRGKPRVTNHPAFFYGWKYRSTVQIKISPSRNPRNIYFAY